MTIDARATLPALLAQRAASDAGKLFLQEVGGASATYAQMHELGLRWAAALRRYGVGPSETVASMLDNCLDGGGLWMGLCWLRAIEVPLSTMLKGALLAHTLNLSRAKVLVTDAEHLTVLEAAHDSLNHLSTIILRSGQAPVESAFTILSRDEFLEGAAPLVDVQPPQARDIATIMYTSGTTGASKAAMVPWGYLIKCAEVQCLAGVCEADVFYHTGAANHAGTRANLLTAAYLGAAVVMRPSFKTKEFWSDVERYGCTYTSLLGAMTHFLLGEPPSASDASSPLRLATMVPVHPEYRAFEQRFGVKLTSTYGSTEVPGVITWGAEPIDDPKSCGRARDGFELRIVDEHDYETPVGQMGELVVRARDPWSLALGYLGMPDKTVEAWRNGWFHTGDAFRLDDLGRYYFVDRIKDAIRRRGENVSSVEVEVEVNSHPDVAECAVVGVPADELEEEIKVFVVPKSGSRVEPEDLIRFLMARMPRYMVPRYVEVVSALPKTPSLRVKKAELKAKAPGDVWDRVAAGILIS